MQAAVEEVKSLSHYEESGEIKNREGTCILYYYTWVCHHHSGSSLTLGMIPQPMPTTPLFRA